MNYMAKQLARKDLYHGSLYLDEDKTKGEISL
jgi:hypothetical protein